MITCVYLFVSKHGNLYAHLLAREAINSRAARVSKLSSLATESWVARS